MHELQQATSQDEHLQCLKEYIIQSWPESRNQISQYMKTNWTFETIWQLLTGLFYKGSIYFNTRDIKETGTATTPYQSYRN